MQTIDALQIMFLVIVFCPVWFLMCAGKGNVYPLDSKYVKAEKLNAELDKITQIRNLLKKEL